MSLTDATSLNSEKLTELNLITQIDSIDFIFIIKTWFDDLSSPILTNYELFRYDRGSHGGDVAIYIHNSTKAFERELSLIHSQLARAISEQLWLQVDVKNEKLLLGCIYHPNTHRSTLRDNDITQNIQYAKHALDETIH